MKTRLFLTLCSVAFSFILVASCSEVLWNEVEGSYFFHENEEVVFENKGYFGMDDAGNIFMACFSGPEVVMVPRDCINIFIPKDCFTLKNNRLTFRGSFKTKVRFFTEVREHNLSKVVFHHLQQDTKVHLSGSVTHDSAKEFFQVGNEYPCQVSLSFSLEDGTTCHLKMNSMTVVANTTIFHGWL